MDIWTKFHNKAARRGEGTHVRGHGAQQAKQSKANHTSSRLGVGGFYFLNLFNSQHALLGNFKIPPRVIFFFFILLFIEFICGMQAK